VQTPALLWTVALPERPLEGVGMVPYVRNLLPNHVRHCGARIHL
jgi:hypothetical protein